MTDEEKKQKKIAAENKAALARCRIGKLEDFEPIVWRVETVPEARVRDRYARNHNFGVLKSWIDIKNKVFTYDIGCCGEIDHKLVDVSFDEIAKEFGWKEFTLEMNNQTIRPTWLKSSL